MTDDNLITTQERAYFFIIPNMVDDLGLSPYAFRLYAHMKRVAGETGACWQSTRTLADTCKMSVGKVSKAKKELQEAGLITVETRKKQGGEYHYVTIRDIMPQNLAAYSKKCSPGEQECSPHERKCSPGETKKNPLTKTQEEVGKNPAAAAFSSKDAGTFQERWTQRFLRDYFENTGEQAEEQAVSKAVEVVLDYIAEKDYPMKYNFDWIRERLERVSRQKQHANIGPYLGS